METQSEDKKVDHKEDLLEATSVETANLYSNELTKDTPPELFAAHTADDITINGVDPAAVGEKDEPTSPIPVEPVSPKPGQQVNFGRRGDTRMHRALSARLANPEMSLLDALIAGGFQFPEHLEGSSDRNVVDSDNVLLCQRKNQLSRRLRLAKKKQLAARSEKSFMDKMNSRDKATAGVPQSMFDASSTNMPAILSMKLPQGAPTFLTAVDANGNTNTIPSTANVELMKMVLNNQQSNIQNQHGITAAQTPEISGKSNISSTTEEFGHEQKKAKKSADTATNQEPVPMSLIQQHFSNNNSLPTTVFGQLHTMPVHPHLQSSFLTGQIQPPPTVTGDLRLLTNQPGGQNFPQMQSEQIDKYLDLAAKSMGIGREQFQSLLLTSNSTTDNEQKATSVSTYNDIDTPDIKESTTSKSKTTEEKEPASNQLSARKTKIVLAKQIFNAEKEILMRKSLIMAGFNQSEIDNEGKLIEEFEKELDDKAATVDI